MPDTGGSVRFRLDLAGQEQAIEVPRAEIEAVHAPILRDFAAAAASRGGRGVVFLAGPPGAGKTALAALWEQLAASGVAPVAVQVLPMDGFHPSAC